MSLSFHRALVVGLFSITALGLTGCDSQSVEGTLTVKSTLNIVTPGGNKKALAAGSYRTAIRVQGKGAQVFIGKNGQQATFKLPSFDPYANTISLSPQQLGQSFGLSGKAINIKIDFERYVEISCVYGTYQDYVCHHDPHGHQVCHWETVEIPGRQTVYETGFDQYRDFNINVVNTANKSVGQFYSRKPLGEVVEHRELIGYCKRSGY